MSVNSTVKEGWMQKLGAVGWKTWKKRWFVLEENANGQVALNYYVDASKAELRGVLQPNGAQQADDATWTLIQSGDGRSVKLKCETRQEAEEWVASLQRVLTSTVGKNGSLKGTGSGMRFTVSRQRKKPGHAQVGNVIVHVVRARSLPPVNTDEWASDPHVVFSTKTMEYRTAPRHKTLDPVWGDESFPLDADVGKVSLKVYSGRTHLGTGVVDVSSVPSDGTVVREWVPLSLSKGLEPGSALLAPAVELVLHRFLQNTVEQGDGVFASLPVLDGDVPLPFDAGAGFDVDQPHGRDFQPHTAAVNCFVEDPIAEVGWYRRFFADNPHSNFVLVDAKMPVVVSILLEQTARLPDSLQAATIVWRKEAVERKVVQIPEGARGSWVAVLEAALLPFDADLSREAKSFRRVDGSSLSKQLMKLEHDTGVPRIKIGVLYVADGQTVEEDMYSNEHGSPAFEEFLTLLGERVRLKGYTGYSAQLDTKNDQSGLYSVVSTCQDIDVMFHVSTLLRYDPTDPQRVQRKRFIGNDIVMIVFVEGGSTVYNVDCMRSQYTNIVAVVQPHDDSTYRFSGGYKRTVRQYGPPSNVLYPKNIAFIDFLLAKCVNGEHATYAAPEFLVRERRTRFSYLEMIVKELPSQEMGGVMGAVQHAASAVRPSRNDSGETLPILRADDLVSNPPQIYRPQCYSNDIVGRVLATAPLPNGHVLLGTADGLFLGTSGGDFSHVVDLSSVAIAVVQLVVVPTAGHVIMRTARVEDVPPTKVWEQSPVKATGATGISAITGSIMSKLQMQPGWRSEGARGASTAVLSQLFVCSMQEILEGGAPAMIPVPGTAGVSDFSAGTMEDKLVVAAVVASTSVELVELTDWSCGPPTTTPLPPVHFPFPVTCLCVTAHGLVAGCQTPASSQATFLFVRKAQGPPMLLHKTAGRDVPRAALPTPYGLLLCYETQGVLLDRYTNKPTGAPPFSWTGFPMHFSVTGPFVIASYPSCTEVRSSANGTVVETHRVETPCLHGSHAAMADLCDVWIPQWLPGDSRFVSGSWPVHASRMLVALPDSTVSVMVVVLICRRSSLWRLEVQPAPRKRPRSRLNFIQPAEEPLPDPTVEPADKEELAKDIEDLSRQQKSLTVAFTELDDLEQMFNDM